MINALRRETSVLGRIDQHVDRTRGAIELDFSHPALEGDRHVRPSPDTREVRRLGLERRPAGRQKKGCYNHPTLHCDPLNAFKFARMTLSALAATGRSVGLPPDFA